MLSPQTRTMMLSMRQQAAANAQSWMQAIKMHGESTERRQNYVRNAMTSQALVLALVADDAGLSVADIRERLSLEGILPEVDHVEEVPEVSEDDIASVMAGLEADLVADAGTDEEPK